MKSTPIIPPGSPLQRNRSDRDSKLFLTVFAILAVHVLLLSGLLIQGCKREDNRTGASPTESARLPESTEPSTATSPAPSTPTPPPAQTQPNPVPAPTTPGPGGTASASVPPSSSEPAVTTNAAIPTPPATAPANPAPTGPTTVYVVKKGDTLTKIAKSHGMTVPALRALNGLKTDRILFGQKLKVPAGTAPTSSSTPTPSAH